MWGKGEIFIIEMIGASLDEIEALRHFLKINDVNAHIVTDKLDIIKVE